jgi:hypothetical protein
MKDTTLKQLVRDRKGDPRGMVIATVVNNTVRIGWSYTNTKAGDRFNKQKAFVIASGRAESGWGINVNVPQRVGKVMGQMAERSVRYYKGVPLA